MAKPKGLHELAEELAQRYANPPAGNLHQNQFQPSFGGNELGTMAAENQFENSNAPSGDASVLQRLLATLSKENLQRLKYLLTDASIATGAAGVFIGQIVVKKDLHRRVVALIVAGVTLVQVGFDFMIVEIDKDLDRREQAGQSE